MSSKGHTQGKELRARIANAIMMLPIEKPKPALRCSVHVVGPKGKIRECGKVALREVKGEGFCGLKEHTLLAFQRQREEFRMQRLTKKTIKKYDSIAIVHH